MNKNLEVIKKFDEKVASGQEYFDYRDYKIIEGNGMEWNSTDVWQIFSGICKKYGKQPHMVDSPFEFRVIQGGKKFLAGKGGHSNRAKNKVIRLLEEYEQIKEDA